MGRSFSSMRMFGYGLAGLVLITFAVGMYRLAPVIAKSGGFERSVAAVDNEVVMDRGALPPPTVRLNSEDLNRELYAYSIK